jgi:pimeloyl-ACP methyl ester carboxylesterase
MGSSWRPTHPESSVNGGCFSGCRLGGLEVVAAGNPLHSVAGDAAYVRDVLSGIGKPVVLVGHSYGGIVITEASGHNSAVVGLVDVAGFAADHRESAFQLSTTFPGSTLADALVAYPVSSGG